MGSERVGHDWATDLNGTCGIKNNNNFLKSKLKDTKNRLVVTRGKGWGLCEKWVESKVTDFQL